MNAIWSADLGWVLDNLTKNVPHVRHALVVSPDGLPLAQSQSADNSQDLTDRLSAAVCGLRSVATNAAYVLNAGAVHQTMVEMDDGFLLVTTAVKDSCLAVITTRDADLTLVGYEMNLLVDRVGEYLTSAPRSGAASPSNRS